MAFHETCLSIAGECVLQSSTILNLGTNNKSWWLDNGIGCRINNMSWVTSSGLSQASRNIPPEQFVEGCLLQYYYVEVIHAAVQCVLSVSISYMLLCSAFYLYLSIIHAAVQCVLSVRISYTLLCSAFYL